MIEKSLHDDDDEDELELSFNIFKKSQLMKVLYHYRLSEQPLSRLHKYRKLEIKPV